MNNTININPNFTPSFTPNIGVAILIGIGGTGYYELISDTRVNENGVYQLKVHTWMGESFFGTHDLFTGGRWWNFEELSDCHAKTVSALRPFQNAKWSGVKVFNMAKVILGKDPLN